MGKITPSRLSTLGSSWKGLAARQIILNYPSIFLDSEQERAFGLLLFSNNLIEGTCEYN